MHLGKVGTELSVMRLLSSRPADGFQRVKGFHPLDLLS